MDKCTAKSKQSGERCKRWPTVGGTVCKFHGGASLQGIASPQFKTGRYSKYLPTKLAESYHIAIEDPELLSLRHEIGMVDAYVSDQLERFGDYATPTQFQEVLLPLIEQRRRLVDSEAKRLKELQTSITIEKAMGIIAALAGIVKLHVTDPDQLRAISAELNVIAGR